MPSKPQINFKRGSLFIFLIALLLEATKSHCGFDDHKHGEIHKMEEPENGRRFLDSTTYQPIRIYFDYTTLNSQNVTNELKSGIVQILTNAQNVFQNILKVKRFSYKLKFTQCDSSVTVPTNISSTGIDTDIIMFPFVDTSITDNTEAYASACVMATTNNRPVAGLIAFTLSTNFTKTNWLSYYSNLAIHEMTHVFVLNPSMFASYVDSNNNPLGLDKVITTKIVNSVNRTLIITPKVVAAGKRHFNCSSLTGIELENYGGTGTAGSHWESRIMLGDYMIGVSLDEAAMSDMTLALFEDSGWYSVNYYNGGLMRYGKNEGCGFLDTPCLNNGAVTYPNEFCNSTYASTCTAGRTTKAICYITNYSTGLDTPFQYFSSEPKKGGFPYADYCPVAAAVTNKTYFLPSTCTAGLSLVSARYDEKISSTSTCYMSTLSNNKVTYTAGAANLAVCYQTTCNSDNTITVTVGNTAVLCDQTGKKVSVTGYSGLLTCPDYNIVCTQTIACTNLVDCATKGSQAVATTFAYSNSAIIPNSQTSVSTASNSSTSTNTNTNTDSGSTETSSGTGSTSTPPVNTGTNSSSTKTNTPTTIIFVSSEMVKIVYASLYLSLLVILL